MTAEILVMNKSAIALAADSAVTIGEGDAGKIYNTVNKLFTLSKYHPVGIMVYANAEYMGVPFETVVKMYRHKIGRRAEPTVDSYTASFVRYLGERLFSSPQQQEQNVVRTWFIVFTEINREIRRRMADEVRLKGNCTATRRSQIITDVTNERLAVLNGASTFPGFARKSIAIAVRRYKTQYEDMLKSALPQAPSKQIAAAWRSIAGLAITKQHDYSTHSGIVIAGFGDRELFPQFAVSRTSGVYLDVHRFQMADRGGISHGGSHAGIIPFAQSEMVQRFMDGVDPTFENFVAGSTLNALRELAKAIINVHIPGNASKKLAALAAVEKAIGNRAKALRENARLWRRQKFVNPIVDAVVNLPKEELANLAEALVNLTSIKRRVSTERETVGGPIDVAVISKGDGFVWIKRKHYFKVELNPRFIHYYRGVGRREVGNGQP